MKTLTLIDWKSSKAFYNEMAIQVSAYSRAYNIKAMKEGTPIVEKLGVLRLDKESGLPHYHDCSDGEQARWNGFCGLVDYYHNVVEPHLTVGSKARFYDFDGKKVPSVTTILGCIDKPALVQWSANTSVEYIKSNMEEIRNPETTPERLDQLLKKAKTAHRTESKKATDIGGLVHDAIETYMKGGKPDAILDGSPKAQSAFLAFLEWQDKVKLEPLQLECTVFHPTLLFGGTFDCLGYLDLEDNIAPKKED